MTDSLTESCFPEALSFATESRASKRSRSLSNSSRPRGRSGSQQSGLSTVEEVCSQSTQLSHARPLIHFPSTQTHKHTPTPHCSYQDRTHSARLEINVGGGAGGGNHCPPPRTVRADPEKGGAGGFSKRHVQGGGGAPPSAAPICPDKKP